MGADDVRRRCPFIFLYVRLFLPLLNAGFGSLDVRTILFVCVAFRVWCMRRGIISVRSVCVRPFRAISFVV